MIILNAEKTSLPQMLSSAKIPARTESERGFLLKQKLREHVEYICIKTDEPTKQKVRFAQGTSRNSYIVANINAFNVFIVVIPRYLTTKMCDVQYIRQVMG